MQKEQFETRIKELLPNMTEQAMDKWEDYAQYLLEEEEETSDFFYDAVYVELCLISALKAGTRTASALGYTRQRDIESTLELTAQRCQVPESSS